MDVNFVTGNQNKFLNGQKALQGSSIELIQKDLDTPERQSDSVEEIACFSAEWAARELGKPVVVTDAGYYISALNGFPGPFIKYINQWLTAEDIVRLLSDKIDRSIVVRGCLAYCQPGLEPVPFTVEAKGSLAEKPATISQGTEINRLFIPSGYKQVIGTWSDEEQRNYWAGVETFWQDLREYVS